MAHHQQVDLERLVSSSACIFDLLQPWLQMRPVDTFRTTVDHDEARLVLRSVMQQQAVALARASHIQTEDHRLLPSDTLERAQYVKHAASLEAAFPAEIGGGLAQNSLDLA